MVDFPDETAQIVDNMIKRYAKPGSDFGLNSFSAIIAPEIRQP